MKWNTRTLASSIFAALAVSVAVMLPQAPAQANKHWGWGPYVIGHEFAEESFVGEWLTRTNANICTASTTDMDVQASNMMWAKWFYAVSSYDTYAFCRAKHFENNNYNLPPYPEGIAFPGSGVLGGGIVSMGLMNNQTSSIQWT